MMILFNSFFYIVQALNYRLRLFVGRDCRILGKFFLGVRVYHRIFISIFFIAMGIVSLFRCLSFGLFKYIYIMELICKLYDNYMAIT